MRPDRVELAGLTFDPLPGQERQFVPWRQNWSW
jgi:hypothetical protein